MEQPNISSDLIRGHIDTIILKAILDGDKFAQQISDYIDEKSDNNYKINQATLYSSLKRLESLNCISSYWHDATDGRRKFFKITENGRSLVDVNLSNWTYSRSVIDKLIGCISNNRAPSEFDTKIINEKPQPAISVLENIEKNPDTSSPVFDTVEKNEKEDKEINFRNILYGLIANENKPKIEEETSEKLDYETTVEEKNVEVAKLNETIAETNYTENSGNNKIDFGDLVIAAAKDGYKIKISSKDSLAPKGVLLINKLNFATSIFTMLLMTIEFIIYFSVYKGKLNTFLYVTIPIITYICPIIFSILFFANPQKLTSKNIQKDGILTAIIITFNILLFSVAGNILFNVDFNNAFIISKSFVLPIGLSIDFIIFTIIRYNFSKSEKFKLSLNKKIKNN